MEPPNAQKISPQLPLCHEAYDHGEHHRAHVIAEEGVPLQIANNITSSGLERRHHNSASCGSKYCTLSFVADSAVRLSQSCSAQLQLRGMTLWRYGNSPFKLTEKFGLRNGRHTHHSRLSRPSSGKIVCNAVNGIDCTQTPIWKS